MEACPSVVNRLIAEWRNRLLVGVLSSQPWPDCFLRDHTTPCRIDAIRRYGFLSYDA